MNLCSELGRDGGDHPEPQQPAVSPFSSAARRNRRLERLAPLLPPGEIRSWQGRMGDIERLDLQPAREGWMPSKCSGTKSARYILLAGHSIVSRRKANFFRADKNIKIPIFRSHTARFHSPRQAAIRRERASGNALGGFISKIMLVATSACVTLSLRENGVHRGM